jgi:hypothetical protein
VLDPTIKDPYFKPQWQPDRLKKGMRQVEEVESDVTFMFSVGVITQMPQSMNPS